MIFFGFRPILVCSCIWVRRKIDNSFCYFRKIQYLCIQNRMIFGWCRFTDNRTRLHPIRTAGGSFLYMSNQNQEQSKSTFPYWKAEECCLRMRKSAGFLVTGKLFPLKILLDGYAWQGNEHDFIANTHFSTVVERYEFDKALRQIIFGAVGILEIGLRTRIINVISEQYGSGLWYLDKALLRMKNITRILFWNWNMNLDAVQTLCKRLY